METFVAHVKRLYEDRDWTQQRMISEAADYSAAGTSLETIRNAVTGRRGGRPSRVAVEAIADALDVPYTDFTVYRLIRASELLDPMTVGDEAALAAADALIALSGESPAAVAEAAAQLREATPPATGPSAPRKRGKGRAA